MLLDVFQIILRVLYRFYKLLSRVLFQYDLGSRLKHRFPRFWKRGDEFVATVVRIILSRLPARLLWIHFSIDVVSNLGYWFLSLVINCAAFVASLWLKNTLGWLIHPLDTGRLLRYFYRALRDRCPLASVSYHCPRKTIIFKICLVREELNTRQFDRPTVLIKNFISDLAWLNCLFELYNGISDLLRPAAVLGHHERSLPVQITALERPHLFIWLGQLTKPCVCILFLLL